jgi:hypothetical protein
MQWEGFGELVLSRWGALGVSLLSVEMMVEILGQFALELVVLDDEARIVEEGQCQIQKL